MRALLTFLAIAGTLAVWGFQAGCDLLPHRGLTNSIGMEFVLIPAGEFYMGSTGEEADDDENPVTPVRISRPYYLGKYEVTQGQWEAVMGSNPSEFSDCGADCPVEQVSWEDVQEFVRKLNQMEGTMVLYRLPTEAEWEYAARGGTAGERYSDDLGAIAWYEENSGGRTQPVGLKEPNEYGLHDMLGNVWEWVQDEYGPYRGGTAAISDPVGSQGFLDFGAVRRVGRGGGWYSGAGGCRAALRYSVTPGSRYSSISVSVSRGR